jgi:hypothetical protein
MGKHQLHRQDGLMMTVVARGDQFAGVGRQIGKGWWHGCDLSSDQPAPPWPSCILQSGAQSIYVHLPVPVHLIQLVGQIFNLIEHDVCPLAFTIGVITPLTDILASVFQVFAQSINFVSMVIALLY